MYRILRRKNTSLGGLPMLAGLGIWLLLVVGPPTPVWAEFTLTQLTSSAPDDGRVALRVEMFGGDQFFDDGGDLGSQNFSLRETRLRIDAFSELRSGVYLAGHLPVVHREIDQAASDLEDATAFGLGDGELAAGWRRHDGAWRWGAEVRWKPPIGNEQLAVSTREVDADAVAALGSGRHEADLWAGATWRRRGFGIGLAAGYRFRPDTKGLRALDGVPQFGSKPQDRVLGQMRVRIPLGAVLAADLGVEGFHEAAANDVHATWGRFGLEAAMAQWRIGANWERPLFGNNYPTVRPGQFQERDPLLGDRFGITIGYAFFQEDQP